ncbi:hypothetical protein [Marinobacter nauticus]|jgi:hypothetical protein|uniref:hypothetical protein n=1 Tax=Marinobacter nauticus TaxID=2743 RepID=UPI001C998C6F|nr:hypothetical protein [Marinobacter nauticus]MBY5937254.1 hypothetical protein [Marinobacter nauticus]MBY5954503.1 hypothetical protein [Marinobacter nauticus]MBY6008275.1 hypothetical protein [Marinobacter nauticus]
MKHMITLIAAFTISTSVFAGNILDREDMKTMNGKTTNNSSLEDILQNEDMQRLHREMTRYSMSESGFEARKEMMSKEGRAYHEALEEKRKNTAG